MRYIFVALVLGLGALMAIPMVLMITGSFMGSEETSGAASRLVPHHPTLEAYSEIFKFPIVRWFLNSAFIAIVKTCLTLIAGLSVAYGISRYQFRGKTLVFAAIAAAILVPGYTSTVPSYIITRGIGLYNTLWALIIPGIFDAAAVWFLAKFIKSIPDSLFDTAKMDGAGPFRTLISVVLPMSLPALAALGCIRIVGAWSDFLGPLIYLRKESLMTMPVGVQQVIFFKVIENMVTHTSLSRIDLAGAVLTTIPGAILFFVSQRYFVNGMFAKTGGK